ncbi:MAG: hypothetical protein ACKO2F_10785 [Cyanobacteriota bacterium]
MVLLPLLLTLSPALPPLQVGTPIPALHQQLLRQGWQLSPEALDARPIDPRSREIKRQLPSLLACSGTGAGFCAFDYVRAGERLRLVAQGAGPLLRWQLGDTWGGRGVVTP